jgi:hypothetical protein
VFRATLVAILVLLTGCSQEPVVCSTIGWSNGVLVRLADDWPEGAERTLTGDGAEGAVSLVDGEAVLRFGFATPDSVTLVVRDAAGVLAEHEADLDWTRVGGSAECGGPSEADAIVVPAP